MSKQTLKTKIQTHFKEKFPREKKIDFVFIDDHQKTFDDDDFKFFMRQSKLRLVKSMRIDGVKVAYNIIEADNDYPMTIYYMTALPIKENTIKTLRLLIKKEISALMSLYPKFN